MYSFRQIISVVIFIIITVCWVVTNAQISDKRLCADEKCTVPISVAKTVLRYAGPDALSLSFPPNVDITIYSKSAGSREDLWGGEISGRRGYFPKFMVKESKILAKATFLVDTELTTNHTSATVEPTQVPSNVNSENSVKVEPNKVEFEIVDGTTIPLSPQAVIIEPSATTSPGVEATAVKSPEVPIPSVKSDEKPAVVVPNESSEEGGSDEEDDSSTETPVFMQKVPAMAKLEDPIKLPTEQTKTETPISFTAPTEQVPVSSNVPIVTEASSSNDPVALPLIEPQVPLGSSLKEANTVAPPPTSESQVPLGSSSNVPSIVAPPPTSAPQVPVGGSSNEPNIVAAQVPLGSIPNEPIAVVSPPAIGSFSDPQIPLVSSSIEPSIVAPPPLSGSSSEPQAPLDSSSNEPNAVTPPPISDPQTAAGQPQIIAPLGGSSNEPLVPPSSLEPVVIASEPRPVSSPSEPPLDVSSNIPQPSDSPINVQATSENIASIPTPPPGVETIEIPQPPFELNLEVTTVTPIVVVNDNLTEGDGQSDSPPPPEAEKVPPVPTLPPLGLFSGSSHRNEPVEELTVDSSGEFYGSSGEGVDMNQSEEVSEENEFEREPGGEVDTSAEKEPGVEDVAGGLIDNIYSFFGVGGVRNDKEEVTEPVIAEEVVVTSPEFEVGKEESVKSDEGGSVFGQQGDTESCDSFDCLQAKNNNNNNNNKENYEGGEENNMMELLSLYNLNSDFLLYLITTALSVIIFLFGYLALDKSKREGPLVAKINKLEKDLLVLLKENQILQESSSTENPITIVDNGSGELVESLQREVNDLLAIKTHMEEQIQSLEKELENSTEVGMELNRMVGELLSSQSGGSEAFKASLDHLQKQLVDQHSTITSLKQELAEKDTENQDLSRELDATSKKVVDLQSELDKLLVNVIKIEEEKDLQLSQVQSEITTLTTSYNDLNHKFNSASSEFTVEIQKLKSDLAESKRALDLKSKEVQQLSDKFKQVKNLNGKDLKSLFESSEIRAELELLRGENQKFLKKVQQAESVNGSLESELKRLSDENHQLRVKYDEVDRARMEKETKLEVLSNYFKEKEAELQKELNKHEALWAAKKGEATSTSERIKFIQEQLQNYKAQNESLKQEILAQEVELKSQISVLDKKAHENWVQVRQTERKLEDAKQEAAQLRHALTTSERRNVENKQRLQSPNLMNTNGDLQISPIDSPPPPLFAVHHGTKSPPPGLPFLPPPGVPTPGMPFMGPPPPFMPPPHLPPPPGMFPPVPPPGDHRPPPLGRMSSPPMIQSSHHHHHHHHPHHSSRYSPSSQASYTQYDSSSPSDSEYGVSPPQRRFVSPTFGRDRGNYGSRRKKGGSSGSENSNESLEKIGRPHHNSKV